MADTSISRVYQFLSREFGGENFQADFKDAIDNSRYGNKDGTVIITEFRSYMLNEFDWEPGDNQNDIINSFWKSIDINKGGTVEGTRISNKNALDLDDLAVADFIVTKVVPAVNDEVAKHVSEAKDAGIAEGTLPRWKDSISTSMINQLTSKIKDKKGVEAMTAEKLQDSIEKAYQHCVNITTADCIADDLIEKMGDLADGYMPAEDAKFTKMKERCVKAVGSDENSSLSDIVTQVTAFVNAYINTAADDGTANSQTSILDDYNYNSDTCKLNDLQKAVLTNKVKDEVQKKLESDDKYKDIYKMYGSAIDEKLKEYIEKTFKNEKASNYKNLIDNISTYVDSFIDVAIADIKAEYKAFTDARDAFIEKVTTTYKDTMYDDAREAVFGDKNCDIAKKVINSYSSLEQVRDAEAKFDAKIKDVVSKMFSSVWANLKSTYEVLTGEAKEVGTLPLKLDSGNENTLSYTSSDTSLVTIDGSGKVTIQAITDVNDKGPVTITVTDSRTGATSSFTIEKITVKPNLSTDPSIDASGVVQICELIQRSSFVNVADQNISGVICTMIDPLKTKYPAYAAKIENAKQATINYYKALIQSIYNTYFSSGKNNVDGNRNIGVTYTSVNGQQVTETANYSIHSARRKSYCNEYDEVSCEGTAGSGLYIGNGYYNSNTYAWIAKDKVKEKFLALYDLT